VSEIHASLPIMTVRRLHCLLVAVSDGRVLVKVARALSQVAYHHLHHRQLHQSHLVRRQSHEMRSQTTPRTMLVPSRLPRPVHRGLRRFARIRRRQQRYQRKWRPQHDRRACRPHRSHPPRHRQVPSQLQLWAPDALTLQWWHQRLHQHRSRLKSPDVQMRHHPSTRKCKLSWLSWRRHQLQRKKRHRRLPLRKPHQPRPHQPRPHQPRPHQPRPHQPRPHQPRPH